MVKRRIQTFLDEEVIEKMAKISKKKYGEESVYRLSAELILKGLEEIERESGRLEDGDAETAGAPRSAPWGSVLRVDRGEKVPPFAKKRR